uniref:Uncharacterized protein n=1 Tax=Arundo donax TaxID=35708 RepID=A0A0A9A3N0_ARUDO
MRNTLLYSPSSPFHRPLC